MAPTELLVKTPPWFKNLIIVLLVGAVAFLGSNWIASKDVNHVHLSTDLEIVKKQGTDHEVRLSVLERIVVGMDQKLDTLIRLQMRANGERR